MDGDPLKTQRDVGSAVVTELPAAGFDNGEEIGRGGFGIVYRCTQVDLDRTAAVKVLTAELDENRERFLREQRAMGRLTGHPNIVSVLQVGETDSGYPYLVMQYHRQAAACRHVDSRRCGAGPLRRSQHGRASASACLPRGMRQPRAGGTWGQGIRGSPPGGQRNEFRRGRRVRGGRRVADDGRECPVARLSARKSRYERALDQSLTFAAADR